MARVLSPPMLPHSETTAEAATTFEDEYDFVVKPPDNFFCPVTFDFILEPHLSNCCDNYLSEKAVTAIQKQGGNCPMCRAPNFTTTYDKLFRQSALEFEVFCTFKRRGCKWRGMVGSLPCHVMSCKSKNNPLVLDKQPKQQSWDFGDISRRDSESMLLLPGIQSGAFLVRRSRTQAGSLCLSVRYDNRIFHYIIKQKKGMVSFLKRSYATLEELLAYHKRAADGLCCALSTVCPRQEEAAVVTETSQHDRRQCEIDSATLKFNSIMSAGEGGELWVGVWNGKVSVQIKKPSELTQDREAILREASIRENLSQDNVVKFFGVCTTAEPMYIVTELCIDGILLDYLRNYQQCPLAFSDKIKLATQVVNGMTYLKTKRIVHRNLAARNIQLGDQCTAKIGNFKYSMRVDDKGTYNLAQTDILPIRWTPPEVFTQHYCTIKSDVWAFGVFLTELVTDGEQPYSEFKNREVQRKIEQGYFMPQPQNCDDKLYQVMKDCWRFEDKERPGFDDLQARLTGCLPN